MRPPHAPTAVCSARPGARDDSRAKGARKNRNPGAGPEGAEPGLHARSAGEGGCSRASDKPSKVMPRSEPLGDRVNRGRRPPARAKSCRSYCQLTHRPDVDTRPPGRATLPHGMAHDSRNRGNPHCDGRRYRLPGREELLGARLNSRRPLRAAAVHAASDGRPYHRACRRPAHRWAC
jgi:hypothetical protein